MNPQEATAVKWSETVIVVDADYVDKVALLLTADFERMLDRRVRQADMARWLMCVALDGGLRAGDNETQVVLVHDKQTAGLAHFEPGNFEQELNNRAFKDDRLGEFVITAMAVEGPFSKDDVMADLLSTVCSREEIKRIIVVPDAENADACDTIRRVLRNADSDQRRVTVLAMQPIQGGGFRQELLGYSLLQALGISADEIK